MEEIFRHKPKFYEHAEKCHDCISGWAYIVIPKWVPWQTTALDALLDMFKHIDLARVSEKEKSKRCYIVLDMYKDVVNMYMSNAQYNENLTRSQKSAFEHAYKQACTVYARAPKTCQYPEPIDILAPPPYSS